jgi:N-acetylglucosaminyldiphosphoundecaprenol N-acetyl-beta-D-mannosaminyltransferase
MKINMTIEKDFSRDVWCLLGLPFDAINLEQTANLIVVAANAKQSCFLSTPNLNFLCASLNDNAFRLSVINSDLSIADGFPIVLIAKMLGIPIKERVAGSDLIDYLFNTHSTENPLKVFFFGGEPGIGERTCQVVNAHPAGLTAVGHYAPGFGSVEDMSSVDIIDFINEHDIDFLIVSLGAKKGQAWIERNKTRIKAPIISHLGAVINFFAGSVKRAPVWMQQCGLEWLWRIYQEPNLWTRYFHDGIHFSGLFFKNILPYYFWQKLNPYHSATITNTFTTSTHANGHIRVELTGQWIHSSLTPLRTEFQEIALKKCDVILNLKHVTSIDSAFLGLCLLLYKYVNANGHSLFLTNPNKQVKKIIRWHNMTEFLA